jgi:hypothetical protein
VKLTPAQIAAYASAAGFSGSSLSAATAIALAESGGNPAVIGDTNLTPGGSVGLFQINLAAHPEYAAVDLLDPQANADAAFAIYQQAGGQFTPWTTYKTGAYASALPSTALATVPSNIIDTSVDDSAPANFFGSIDPETLIIGGVLALGLVLWWVAD